METLAKFPNHVFEAGSEVEAHGNLFPPTDNRSPLLLNISPPWPLPVLLTGELSAWIW